MPSAESGPRPVVIAGAGSAGELLADCLDGDARWKVVAFIDEEKGGGELSGLPIFHPDRYDIRTCAEAFMAIGTSSVRRSYYQGLSKLGLVWLTYIDRRSIVSKAAHVGEGCVVFPFASVGPGTSIGRFGYLAGYSAVGKHAELGEFVSLSPRASAGNCKIGSDCAIGYNSACLDGARLGEAVELAPYTWVRKAIPAGSFVAGSPPRITHKLSATGGSTVGSGVARDDAL